MGYSGMGRGTTQGTSGTVVWVFGAPPQKVNNFFGPVQSKHHHHRNSETPRDRVGVGAGPRDRVGVGAGPRDRAGSGAVQAPSSEEPKNTFAG